MCFGTKSGDDAPGFLSMQKREKEIRGKCRSSLDSSQERNETKQKKKRKEK